MSRLFAVVPAAGRSRRMGRPKLLMRLGETTVIGRLLDHLQQAGVVERLVVVRRDDEPLAAAVRERGATLVQPALDPPDMRASVACALEALQSSRSPSDRDGWLLIPADAVLLEPGVIANLREVWDREQPLILVPEFEGRRGHPVCFRWGLAREVGTIPPDHGVNWLVQQHAAEVRTWTAPDRSVLFDLDTPEDYEALCRQLRSPE